MNSQVSGTRLPKQNITAAKAPLTQNSTRQLEYSVMNPAIAGPSTGPKKGASANSDSARDLSLAVKRSETVPPLFVRAGRRSSVVDGGTCSR